MCPRIVVGGLPERPMELVLKTSGQKCLVGSNPTPSAQKKQDGSQWAKIPVNKAKKLN